MSKQERKDITIDELEKQFGCRLNVIPKRMVSIVKVPEGSVVEIDNIEFIVLKSGVNTLVMAKNLYEIDCEFGETNNYSESKSIHEVLKGIKAKLLMGIKEDELISKDIDLTSDNGFNEYGAVQEELFIPTLEVVRTYARLLSDNKVESDWWTSTPHGTKNHGSDSEVCCVDKDGMIVFKNSKDKCYVRPMMLLKYSTKVEYDGLTV